MQNYEIGKYSVDTILSKIKNTLGNYEYFYDIDGNFVFQHSTDKGIKKRRVAKVFSTKNLHYLFFLYFCPVF